MIGLIIGIIIFLVIVPFCRWFCKWVYRHYFQKPEQISSVEINNEVKEVVNKFYRNYNAQTNLKHLSDNFIRQYHCESVTDIYGEKRTIKYIKKSVRNLYLYSPVLLKYKILDCKKITDEQIKITVQHSHSDGSEYSLSYIIQKMDGNWLFHHIILTYYGTIGWREDLDDNSILYCLDYHEDSGYPYFVRGTHGLFYSFDGYFQLTENEEVIIECYRETNFKFGEVLHRNIYQVFS